MEDSLNVKDIMDSWTLQEGFPLITVEVNGRVVKIKQERFLKGANTLKNSRYDVFFGDLLNESIVIF